MTNYSDLINGCFEAFAGGFAFLNIRKLYKDKQVKGVSLLSVIFFSVWGVWNVIFYPLNGLWISFVGGLVVVILNIIWVFQMRYYIKKENDGK